MTRRRVLGSVAATAIIAGALAVAPALGATEKGAVTTRPAAVARLGGSFTPAAADPRLAAIMARSGLAGEGFRFTPAQTRAGTRAITVAVRARNTRAAVAAAESAPSVGLAPIAYNLGVAVGWKRFAVLGDVKRVDAGPKPGSREAFDLGVSYSGNRFGAQVKAAADRPIVGLGGAAPTIVEDSPSYSLDVGGSYKLTRNLDVTAGVRYRTDRERLARFADDRRDSQAVYVGTAFRF